MNHSRLIRVGPTGARVQTTIVWTIYSNIIILFYDRSWGWQVAESEGAGPSHVM